MELEMRMEVGAGNCFLIYICVRYDSDSILSFISTLTNRLLLMEYMHMIQHYYLFPVGRYLFKLTFGI